MSNPYDKPTSANSSVLGPTLKFKGELSANEDLLIQGEIEGSINHTSNLTIGQEGKLKANVKADYIAVEGTVEGNLAGTNSVVVKESANINGNIYSPTVTLREGSTFNGQIDMTGKEMPQAAAPSRSKSDDASGQKRTKSKAQKAAAEEHEAANQDDDKSASGKKSSANAA